MQHEMAKMKIDLNICSEDEHVHEIERMNCTIEERVHGTFNSLPIKQYPRKMIIEIVYLATFWLNIFPPFASVCGKMSTCTIMTGATVDFNKHCRL
eukprot:9952937-Ditylum_brightwellii.AAC.1